ncbi:hypothetical protein EDF75_2940 [Raoultella sp. BIGb0149]|uniref:hypothetical protein n=1 Tax=Raoultella sp. BIGb0149 TaxID=2485116 RepID=UPI0010EA1367|nr:hypothetical protein [Raoultella sp. BIGb0149]TDQ23556.1 hypothetical protein EDF75_2940 [Raoultella sp. BIGb0149]
MTITEKVVRLYLKGVSVNENGTEAEHIDVFESQQYTLYAMGWRLLNEEETPT